MWLGNCYNSHRDTETQGFTVLTSNLAVQLCASVPQWQETYLNRIAFIGVILVITYEGMISIKVQKINVPAFKMRMYIHDISIGTVET